MNLIVNEIYQITGMDSLPSSSEFIMRLSKKTGERIEYKIEKVKNQFSRLTYFRMGHAEITLVFKYTKNTLSIEPSSSTKERYLYRMSFEVLKDYWGVKSNFKTPSYMNKKWSEIHPCIQFLIK